MSAKAFKVSPADVDAQADAAEDSIYDEKSLYPGMTYEHGVAAALAWVLTGEEPPMPTKEDG